MRRASLLILLSLCTAGVLTAAGSLTVTVKTAKGELLADAVVSLTPLDHTPALVPATDTVIAQEDKEYEPFVTPLMVGTRVVFPNRDSIQHHIYSLSKPKRFEKPLYASGAEESIVFDQPGVVVLGCNIHDWMVAYVLVLNTPYFAKTADNGRVELTGLPSGRYQLEAWHPRVTKPERRELTVSPSPGAALELTLTLKPDRRIRRAPENKTGGY
jgi:plastocyanin